MMMRVRMEGCDGVEETGLVLWWAGDKEMMVLGGKVGVVCLLVGGVEMGSERGVKPLEGVGWWEVVMMLAGEWIECRRYMLVGLDSEEMMDWEN